MTYRDAVRDFKANLLPAIREREVANHDGDSAAPADKPMRAEAWHFYKNNLHRAGEITDRQADAWQSPFRW